MTTIIRVKHTEHTLGGNGEGSVESGLEEKEVLVNVNCPIKIILHYIREVAGIDDAREFDLCDENNWQLRNVSVFGPHASGLDVLEADLTYIIITYERDGSGQMTNFAAMVQGRAFKKSSEILTKIQKSIRRNSSAKSSLRKENSRNRFA